MFRKYPPERRTAVDDGEIVVFLIGMTFNRLRSVREWWPVFTAMPKMLRELASDPSLGMLSMHLTFTRRGPLLIQYWRSVDQLEACARGRDHAHMPAWAAFMKSSAFSSGAVGIWHETYVTEPGKRESLYFATPSFGLAEAVGTELVGPDTTTAAKRRASGAAAGA